MTSGRGCTELAEGAVTPARPCGEVFGVTFPGSPPQLPRPPRVFRRHLVLNVTLLVLTLGLWGPVWVLVWWTVDARNYAEQQRYHREWAVYRAAALS